MLLFAIGFNLRLYRLEPTALIDPNDNTFQFALVDRTNQVWDFATRQCSKNYLTFGFCHLSFLIDHWVPNWAEGYNLPYYYSHIPQIAIVGSHRLFSFLSQFQISNFKFQISLFQYYHWIIHLLLSFFPLPIFIALRVIGLPWLTAGIGALLATHISTDGLYGLDPPSFLWRGYGLASQLFAMVFMPLAIAYSYRWLNQRNFQFSIKAYRPQRDFWFAVLFLFATTAGHLGIGIIAMMSVGIIALTPVLLTFLKQEPITDLIASVKTQLTKLMLLAGTALFFLSYWVIPVVLGNNYHNISFWDPIWKFDSYDWITTVTRFFNGDLFDFGRFPVFTLLVLMGVFVSLWPRTRDRRQETGDKGKNNNVTPLSLPVRLRDLFDHGSRSGLTGQAIQPSFAQASEGRQQNNGGTSDLPYAPFALLFAVWMALYFGRTTWGGLIDLIPGMEEFHLSRFIVGLHLAGFFLAPIGFGWLIRQGISAFRWIQKKVIGSDAAQDQMQLLDYAVVVLLLFLIIPPTYRQTVRYSEHNDRLILQGNENASIVQADADALFATIRERPPGRVFAGRGGWWGKDFFIAETPYYMHLSTYGVPTVLWLPQTWSPNSDTEQYFSEDVARDYDLYNIRYIAAPPNQATQKFWKPIADAPTWKLYEASTSGYFTTGVRPAIVAVNKRSFLNVVRLWIQSETHERKLFPELTFARGYPKNDGLPNFRMLDEVTYTVPDGSRHNVFAEPPLYMPPGVQSQEQFNNLADEQYSNLQLLGPEVVDADMVFKTTIEVGKDCVDCIVILKQSFHPNWVARVDGKKVTPINIFPFFVAVPVSQEGTHEIVMSYEPGRLKMFLALVELAVLALLISSWLKIRRIAARLPTQ